MGKPKWFQINKNITLWAELGDWIYEVVSEETVEREKTFVGLINKSRPVSEWQANLLSTIRDLLSQNEKTSNGLAAFLNETFTKLEHDRLAFLEMGGVDWPVYLKVRWMKRDGLIYWSFYMNTESSHLRVDYVPFQIVSTYDEIDDTLEVYSLSYKPRR